VIVFDWDDTLFPTTALKQYVEHTSLVAYFRHRYSQALKLLDLSLVTLFTDIKEDSEVIILSNATIVWLDYTLTFLPNFSKYIKSTGVKVLSA
jgi:hypothetical protein